MIVSNLFNVLILHVLRILCQSLNANKCKILVLFSCYIESILVLKTNWHFVSLHSTKKIFAQNKETQEMAQINNIMLNIMIHDLYSLFLISQFNGNFEKCFAIIKPPPKKIQSVG